MTIFSHLHITFYLDGHWTAWTEDHCCTDRLSSLHISSHHCTFCESLHAKTSPGSS